MADDKKDTPDASDVAKELKNLAAFVRKLEAKVDRHSANWVKYVQTHFDANSNGKIGGAKVWALLSVLLLGVVISGAYARNMSKDIVVWYDSDSTYGTAYIQGSGGAATLKVDAVSATIVNATYTNGSYYNLVALNGLTVNTNATVGGTLDVTGAGTVGGALGVTGFLTYSTITSAVGKIVGSNITANGTLGVTGASTLGGSLDVTGFLTYTTITSAVGKVVASNVTVNGTITGTDVLAPAGMSAGFLPSDVLVSNAVGTLTMSNVTVNGTISGTDVLAPGGISAGILPSDVTVSNALGTATMSNLTLNANATIAGEAVVDGKFAVVGPDATTAYMMVGGTGIVASGTATITFPTVFGSTAVRVVLTPHVAGTNVMYCPIATVTASNAVVACGTDGGFFYQAIGPRP